MGVGRFLLACAALVSAVLLSADDAGALPPSGELDTGDGAWGSYGSLDVGTRFTDGLNVINVTAQARGPVRLISARPATDDGGTLKVIGTLARVVPDMLPAGADVGGFQRGSGFPPVEAFAAGAVPVEGLVVTPSKPGEVRWIEIQIGYEVVAPGRSTRRGVELVYEYEGAVHKALIPSYLEICAPSTVDCDTELDFDQ